MINLDEIERRANATSEGWWLERRPSDLGQAAVRGRGMEDGRAPMIADWLAEADATFIAHARTDVPALIAEVRRLREAIHGMIGQCRFSCTSASHCRVCGTGYEAINEP